MRTSAQDVLASYVDALYPIIYVNHFDFPVIDEIIADISEKHKIIEYDNALGIVDFNDKHLMMEMGEVSQFLDLVKDEGYNQSTFLVLKDVHNKLDDPKVISLLKYIATRNMEKALYNTTVFILSSKLHIPEELEELITVYDMPLPTEAEIINMMRQFANDLDIKIKEEEGKNVLSEIAISFKGMNEFQIQQILNLAYQDGGCIDLDDRQLILRQKEQLIKKAGMLEMINVKEQIDDIGGLENLKEWLYRKAEVFSQLDKAIKFGVDIPKGILIVGMPGCGKSLAAKATAKLFDIPLLRLDVGRLLGKYVGESEANMRKALKLAEAISPCVLWIDEIEKAFSGVGDAGDSGGGQVTKRLFGQFLTWMQEKEDTIFIVATANDISGLPPEFLRKGRFDELFSVEFPNIEERRDIIEIHLRKRNIKRDPSLDTILLATETKGYNGADLEAIVKEAVEDCFINGKTVLETDDLMKAKNNIKSIETTLGDRIEKIRTVLKKMDLKPASAEGGKKARRRQNFIRKKNTQLLNMTN
ncbi:MAG: AAA family ATPase [Schwartzia sp.]|nr:AAA family ATPase [Schwartzia sp. (in: firmicutes)]